MVSLTRRNALSGLGAIGATAMLGPSVASAVPPPLFRVPPEEGPHELTFMQWPVTRYVYDDPYYLEEVQQAIADIANAIAAFEPVVLLMAPEHRSTAQRMLSSDVEIWDIPTDDLWARDAGPLFVTSGNGHRAIHHLQFNGWGNKQPHPNDGNIAAAIADRLQVSLIPTGLVGEAGGAEQDGHGLVIAHESSWVIENRNPGLSRDQIGEKLKMAYGADRVIWSPGVWDQDITDYHIDSLARFTGPGRVLINQPQYPDMSDPFHRAAAETERTLREAGLDVEVIPEPEYRRVNSWDFVASYANYYVCNGAVIAAQFGDSQTDRQAEDALRRHYPGREIVTLNVDALGELGGGIHCATQQMPAL